ncbi:MAG: hypothetical protein M0P77_09075 [Firmicutes bacterium]|nr:hypothetical protein [Bacillota bacterium]
MDVLRKKNIIYITFAILGLFSVILFIFLINMKQKFAEQISTIISILGMAILVRLLIHKYKKHNSAKLIIENSILRLNTYIIRDMYDETGKNKAETTEFYISYFGILFEDRIIRFNQKGIQLKSVEIGPDYFLFAYGKGKQIKNIKFVRPFIEPTILDDFSKRLYYETGIKPIFISD